MGIRSEWNQWVGRFFQELPGSIGGRLRRWLWSREARIGKRASIARNVRWHGLKRITIGDDFSVDEFSLIIAAESDLVIGHRVALNRNVHLNSSHEAPITIGDDVLIGPNVVIRSANHRFTDSTVAIRVQGHDSAPIRIESDVWIAANAVILPGVTIQTGAVIGAGAVVSRDIPANSVAVGVPAKVVKKR